MIRHEEDYEIYSRYVQEVLEDINKDINIKMLMLLDYYLGNEMYYINKRKYDKDPIIRKTAMKIDAYRLWAIEEIINECYCSDDIVKTLYMLKKRYDNFSCKGKKSCQNVWTQFSTAYDEVIMAMDILLRYFAF